MSLASQIAREILAAAPFVARESEIEGLAHAYRVQAEVTADLMVGRPGRRIAGYKIAFNRPSSMDYYGLNEPCYAPIFSDEVVADGARLELADFADLVLEAEIAVRMAAHLDGNEDAAAVARSVGAYLPAIEVMDARGAFAHDPSAAAAVAQRVYSRGAVLGREAAVLPDLAQIVARLTIGGILIGEAKGAAPQAPLDAVAWLARRLAADGLRLEAGMIVLTGTHLPGRQQAEPGLVTVTLDPLGSVSVDLA